MGGSWWVLVLGVATAAVVAYFVWRPVRAASRVARFAHARKVFHTQRERLEAKFVQLAASHAAPPGPRWADCDFADDVAYVRNRNTKELAAFVAVNVVMDDFDGPPTGISDVVGNLHVATAVFRFDRDHWETDGRAILNLSPAQAIRFYQNDLEVIDQELAGRA